MKIPEDDEEASKHTYAPRDTPILLVGRKDNSHGLGYHPGMGLNESLGVKSGGSASGPKLSGVFRLSCACEIFIYDRLTQRDSGLER